MNTLINKGKSIEVAAPSGGYTSGQPVLVGSLVGVSANKYNQGDTAVIWLTGMHNLPKAAEAWNAGDKLYWDDTAKAFTKTSTSNTFAGYAGAASLNTATTGAVILRQ